MQSTTHTTGEKSDQDNQEKVVIHETVISLKDGVKTPVSLSVVDFLHPKSIRHDFSSLEFTKQFHQQCNGVYQGGGGI